MVKFRIMDQLVLIGSPVGWTKKRGVILRKAAATSAATKPQRDRFAAAARANAGKSRKEFIDAMSRSLGGKA